MEFQQEPGGSGVTFDPRVTPSPQQVDGLLDPPRVGRCRAGLLGTGIEAQFEGAERAIGSPLGGLGVGQGQRRARVALPGTPLQPLPPAQVAQDHGEPAPGPLTPAVGHGGRFHVGALGGRGTGLPFQLPASRMGAHQVPTEAPLSGTADGAHALNDDLSEVLGIRNFLLDIQYGRRPDTYGWTERVC